MVIFDPRMADYARDGHYQLEAKQAYTTAILHEALVKFGITDGRLDPKALRENAGAIADYVEKRLLGDVAGNDDVDAKKPFTFDRTTLDGLSTYDRAKSLLINLSFDRNGLAESIKEHGLDTPSIVQHHLPTLYRVSSHLHQAASMADFNPDNLAPVVEYLEANYGIQLTDQLKHDPSAIRGLLRDDREGKITPRSLEERAGITVPNSGAVVRATAADRQRLGI